MRPDQHQTNYHLAPAVTGTLSDVWRSLRAWPVFACYVAASLVVAGIIGLITVGVIDLGFSHFGDPAHRTHDVIYGLLFTTGVVGGLAQLRWPEHNGAGMAMALIPGAALLSAAVLSSDVDTVFRHNPLRYVVAVSVVAALVHPGWRVFFGSLRARRCNPPMLGLVALAAVPLLAFASTNIERQQSAVDAHRFIGHYGFAAALSFTMVAVGLLASLRPPGFRLTAWAAGLLAVALGVTSLLYPNTTSSLSRAWSLAAIAWGITFVASAAMTDGAPNMWVQQEKPEAHISSPRG